MCDCFVVVVIFFCFKYGFNIGVYVVNVSVYVWEIFEGIKWINKYEIIVVILGVVVYFELFSVVF